MSADISAVLRRIIFQDKARGRISEDIFAPNGVYIDVSDRNHLFGIRWQKLLSRSQTNRPRSLHKTSLVCTLFLEIFLNFSSFREAVNSTCEASRLSHNSLMRRKVKTRGKLRQTSETRVSNL